MEKLLLVGCGGFLGSVARYGMTLWAPRGGPESFPGATFAVNLLGCLLIGALLGWDGARPSLGENGRALLVAGVLGGFTTFSAFGFETFELIQRGKIEIALLYSGGSLLGGILAVALGWTLGRKWAGG